MLEVLIAFFGSLALTPLLCDRAHRSGLVDRPSDRKTHQGPVPLVGGIAMVVTFMAASVLLGCSYAALFPLLSVTLLVLLIGVIDDRHELSPRAKLMAQIVAASLMAVWADQVIHSLGDPVGLGVLGLGIWAVPFTVFVVAGVMNAINMIDGMDGLAGGVSAIAIAWLAALAAVNANGAQLELLLLLWLGAVTDFLLFNLRYPVGKRARVFMGDGGSLVLGLTLAWFCVELTQGSGVWPAVYPITAVWILGVPIMDTVYLILRRAYRHTSPFAPDRRHIHHTLLVMGLHEGWAVFVILVLSAVFGAVGVLGWYWGVPEPMLWGLFLATFSVYCVVMQHWRILAGRFLGKRRALELGRNRASGEIERRRVE